jgi:hypothetical protein
MKKLLLAVFLALPALAAGQVYSANVTSGGTGYTTVPTVTATGGGCVAEPTFTASIASGAVTALAATFMGTGCTTPPALAFTGGGGSSAAATALIAPASIFVLASVPSLSGSSLQPAIGGTNLAWQYACELTVPKARVPFYSSLIGAPFRMPGTNQSSQIILSQVTGVTGAIAAAYTAALSSGVMTEFQDYYIANSSVSAANVEVAIVAACAGQQVNLNNWNPWMAYGTFYNGTAWTIQGF